MTEPRADVQYRRAAAEDEPALRVVLKTANFDNVPSPEMPELRLENYYVAEVSGTIVGCCGWIVLPDGHGKTTLMAVDPNYRGWGIGQKLQELRMLEMRRLGCSTVITNADIPATITWYQRKFGYRVIGTLPKEHEFGDPTVDHWTTLEADIEAWYRSSEYAKNSDR